MKHDPYFKFYYKSNSNWNTFKSAAAQQQGHIAAGRIMSMKNSSDTIGNQTRDLPTCSAVPQPTALPRGPAQMK